MIVIGLDGIEVSTLFSLLEELPHFKKIIGHSIYRRIQSCHPFSRISQWCSLATGLNPSELGIYSCQQRNSYDQYSENIVDRYNLKRPAFWDILGKQGYQSIIMGVPFFHIYPQSLEEELSNKVEMFTIKARDLESLYQINKKQFATARYLLKNKKWDLFMMVDSSLKQFQTLSWNQGEKLHNVYRQLDMELGTILTIIPDDTKVVLFAGYGTQNVEGVFHLNEWLQQEGYLKLKEVQKTPTLLTEHLIDWKKTQAWGKGGTLGSVFLNVKRRESQGVIPKEKYEYIQNRLVHKIVSLTDLMGIPLYAKVLKTSKIFQKSAGVSADLFLNFRNLCWRSSSLIGTGETHSRIVGLYEKVNMRPEGIIITADLRTKYGKEMDVVQTIDLAPTILRFFGVNPTKSMVGKIIFT